MSIITKSSISGASANNFVLSVGTSGGTTYVLDKTYPSGSYDVSAASDSTYDIYAIALDGTSAGYTNTTKLTVSTNFKEIVILGASANEVFTFEYSGKVTPPTSSGDVASAGAFVTSVSTGSMQNIDDTTTVTGGNFAADVEAYFIDQSDNEVAAKTVVRNSSTEIVITRPDSFSAAGSPFTIKVVNPGVTLPTGSSAHLLSNAVTAGTNPVWQTAASQSFNQDEAASLTLVASDTESSDVDYAITAGSLPTGLSLDGETGVISGTPTVAETSVFTVRATDAGGNFVDREFTFEVASPVFEIEYLIVAGGGGANDEGGGGGAGGYRSSVQGELSGGNEPAESIFSFDLATNYTVTVGAGGSGSSDETQTSGSDSIFSSVTSTGGGRGADFVAGGDGGSGGGGYRGASYPPGSGTFGQGNDGGDGASITGNHPAGGGGGAGQVGENGTSTKSGDGGDGLESNITGSLTYRAGGGAGGFQASAGDTAGTGGLGGGGDASATSSGQSGQVNTGGGGGASIRDETGGNGGSGVVILRYSNFYEITIGAGLTATTLQVGTDKVTTITAGTGNVSFA